MYTGGVRGFESRCPAYGPLAQWTERLVTIQDVAGSSPARPTGSMVWFRAVIVRYLLWRMLRRGHAFRLARELMCAILCSHSSQSSSGTGWVYSACGGMLVDAPD